MICQKPPLDIIEPQSPRSTTRFSLHVALLVVLLFFLLMLLLLMLLSLMPSGLALMPRQCFRC